MILIAFGKYTLPHKNNLHCHNSTQQILKQIRVSWKSVFHRSAIQYPSEALCNSEFIYAATRPNVSYEFEKAGAPNYKPFRTFRTLVSRVIDYLLRVIGY